MCGYPVRNGSGRPEHIDAAMLKRSLGDKEMIKMP